jgi:hypothetical protein
MGRGFDVIEPGYVFIEIKNYIIIKTVISTPS